MTFFKKGKEIFWFSLWLSELYSGKYLVSSEFDSVPGIFSIKASLSYTIPSQVCLLTSRITLSATILLPAVFRWTPP